MRGAKSRAPQVLDSYFPPQKQGGFRRPTIISTIAPSEISCTCTGKSQHSKQGIILSVEISKTCHFLAPKKQSMSIPPVKDRCLARPCIDLSWPSYFSPTKSELASHLLSQLSHYMLVCWENMLKRCGHFEQVRILTAVGQ